MWTIARIFGAMIVLGIAYGIGWLMGAGAEEEYNGAMRVHWGGAGPSD